MNLSFILGQDGLNDEQLKEYNRNELTIDRVTEATGWYSSFISSVNSWQAYKGFDEINEEEFFRLTGYKNEMEKSRIKNNKVNQMTLFGVTGLISGSVLTVIPRNRDTYTISRSGFEEIYYPYRLPGLLIGFLGMATWYYGASEGLRPVEPYETVKEISDSYNVKLLEKIKSDNPETK